VHSGLGKDSARDARRAMCIVVVGMTAMLEMFKMIFVLDVVLAVADIRR
jgi:hypothetical protein